MKQPLEIVGVTMQVRADDLGAAIRWYSALLGRPSDDEPGPGLAEWEIMPNCWLQVAEGAPAPGNGPLHLGVADIEADRERLEQALHVSISPIERIEGEVAWCNFTDSFGNRLGLFQDLADVTALT